VQVGVDGQAGSLDRLRLGPHGRHAGSAQHRLHPGHQLAHAERLGQVVVAPDLQRMHLVVLGAPGRDDHDRRLDPLAAQRLGDPPAVHSWQHQIDDGHIRALVAQLSHRPLAILGDLDVHPGAPQMGRHRVGDHPVVLGDQYPCHATIVRSAGPARPGCPARGLKRIRRLG
jgi:hypothetical protein